MPATRAAQSADQNWRANKFFTTTTQEMGNEARLPPPLTGIGDKLKPQIIERIIAKVPRDRPYMLTRMPAFAQAPLPLHLRLGSVSCASKWSNWTRNAEQPYTNIHTPDSQLIADGRKLVGGTGLACIKCHTYDKRGTPGIQAIDMLTMTERLREDWFHRTC